MDSLVKALETWQVAAERVYRISKAYDHRCLFMGQEPKCYCCGCCDIRCRYEKHHVGGRHCKPLVILCSRCHDIISWEQYNYPPEMLKVKPMDEEGRALRLEIGWQLLRQLRKSYEGDKKGGAGEMAAL